MKTVKIPVVIIFGMFILNGCAGNYKSINPQVMQYEDGMTLRDLPVAYNYDVLHATNNRKYNRKANEADINLISVRITNNTDSSLNVNDDIILYHGNTPIIPMEPEIIQGKIKQKIPGYLFYLSFTSLSLLTEDGENIPIGWILGPALTLANILIASGSNQKLLLDLNTYSLRDKSIPPRETLYGIIAISNMGYSPISAEIIER